jgi:HSP20 family protein
MDTKRNYLTIKENKMRLMKYDPFNELDLLRDRMNQLWGTFWGRETLAAPNGTFSPTCDIAETDNEVIVKLDIPGINEKEVSLSLSGDNLIIKGERKSEKEEKDKHYHRVERFTGSFERIISLPLSVDKNAIKAEYNKGVLEVTLPKVPEVKPKEILIKVK